MVLSVTHEDNANCGCKITPISHSHRILLASQIDHLRRVSSRAPTKQKSQLTYRELLPAIPIYLPFLRDKLYKCT